MPKWTKPKKFDRDIIVIGAGAAGLVTSYIAAALKAKVTLIEKHKMGGDCLNTGCVPSKALIRSAKFIHDNKNFHRYGIQEATTKINFTEIMQRVTRVIQQVEPHDSVERYTDLGVECLQGKATITSPHTVEIEGKTLTTRNIVIATGARPNIPQIPGLRDVPHYTSDTIWQLRKPPKKLLVLGGGPIGCELTQSFARLDIETTQIEKGPQLLSREDTDVSKLITNQFHQEGIDVRTNHTAEVFTEEHGQFWLTCDNLGKEVRIPIDTVLVALGRSAHTKDFGLEELGIGTTQTGTIEVNQYLQTKHPNIYACGDVVGPYQFTHTAAHQAYYATVNALFRPFKKFKVDYSVIPWSTFTDPEVARVGLNEQEALAKKIPYEVTKFELSELDRAIADETTQGFIKILTKPGKDKILGVTIVGHHAGDLISEYILAMKNNLGLNKILSTIHIYPTMAELNKYAAGQWKRNHAPQKILTLLEKFHTWRRN